MLFVANFEHTLTNYIISPTFLKKDFHRKLDGLL